MRLAVLAILVYSAWCCVMQAAVGGSDGVAQADRKVCAQSALPI